MIDFDPQELQSVLRTFDEFGNTVNDPKIRRKAFNKAAQIVKKAAQSKVKDSQKPHYRYNGSVKTTYYPGNLRKSLKRLPFRKTPDVFVGPVLRNKRAGKEVGRNARTAEGYYAAMSRGKESNADKFRRQVLEAGLIQSSAKAIESAKKEIIKQIEKLKQKTGT